MEWLLIEWPPGEDAPTKYWLSTLPEDTALDDLVSLVKLRWRVERDYRELKQEIGLDHRSTFTPSPAVGSREI